jgi:Ni/Co efflux regulator RcnB
MNKTILALTTTLLLAGGAATTASAQYYYEAPVVYATPVYESPPVVVQGEYGAPIDSRYAEYVRKNARGRLVADKDCDGIPDRFDNNEPYNTHDRDCDGIPNSADHRDNPRYAVRERYSPRYVVASTTTYAPAYVEPYAYTTRYSVGSYLPQPYYNSAYYIDYRPYGLAPPPYGYAWARVGNDVYLVSTSNGLIADVNYSMFR